MIGGRRDGCVQAEPASARISGGLTLAALCFGPLAFGATERWAIAAFQALAFLALALRLAASSAPSRVSPPTVLIASFCLIALLAASQSLNVRAINAPATFRPFSVSLSAARAAAPQWLSYAGFAWLSARFVDGRRAAWQAAAVVFALGVLVALLGIARHGAANEWIYGIRLNLHYTSSFGPFVNRDHAATLLGAALFVGAGMAGANIARRSGRSSPTPMADVIAIEILILFGLGIILYGLTIAFSRGLSLASAATMEIMLASFAATARGRVRIVLWLAAAAVPIVGVLSILGHPQLLGLRATGPDLSRTLRLMIWQGALKMFSDHPVFGTGLGAFTPAFRPYQTFDLSLIADHAHSDWLEMLCQGGVVGALLYAGGIFSAAGAFARRWLSLRSWEGRWLAGGFGAGALVVMLHSFVDFPLQGAGNTAVFISILVFGTAATQVFGPLAERETSHSRVPARRALTAAALVLASLSALTVYVQAHVTLTDRFPADRFLAWRPPLGLVADDAGYRIHLARALTTSATADAEDGRARVRRALTALAPLIRREPSDPEVEALRKSLTGGGRF